MGRIALFTNIRKFWSLPWIPYEIPPIEITIHPESTPPPADLREVLVNAVEKIHLRLREISSSKSEFRNVVFEKQRPYVIKALEHFSERRVIRFLWVEGVPSFPEDVAGHWVQHNAYFICIFKRRLRNISTYTIHGISKEKFWAHFKNYLEQLILETLIAGICTEETEKPLTKTIKGDIHFAAYLLFPIDLSEHNSIIFTIEPTVSLD